MVKATGIDFNSPVGLNENPLNIKSNGDIAYKLAFVAATESVLLHGHRGVDIGCYVNNGMTAPAISIRDSFMTLNRPIFLSSDGNRLEYNGRNGTNLYGWEEVNIGTLSNGKTTNGVDNTAIAIRHDHIDITGPFSITLGTMHGKRETLKIDRDRINARQPINMEDNAIYIRKHADESYKMEGS
jgi:hypothetical protein